MWCPKTMMPCCDDLCVSGCLQLDGVPLLERCRECGQLYGEDLDCVCAEYQGGDYRDDWLLEED